MIELFYVFVMVNALAAIIGAVESFKSRELYTKVFFGVVAVSNAVTSFVCFTAIK